MTTFLEVQVVRVIFIKLFSYFWPQVVERVPSKVNGEITVMRFFGSYSLRVGGLTQSGGLVDSLWKKTIRFVKSHYFQKQDPASVLILGLGGGSVAGAIRKYWAHVPITALELDTEIVTQGKKYLALDVSNVNILFEDAYAWLEQRSSKTFDLIVVDLFSGMQGPLKLSEMHVLERLAQKLSTDGVAVINRGVFEGQDLTAFQSELEEVFEEVCIVPTSINKMFAVRMTT